MQSNDNTIFVGTKISEKLRDHLDSSNASVKQFFAENDPEYLQVLYIDYDEYIGKMTESGASLEDLSNLRMNVKTMLRMICPKFSFPDNAIKIFAVAPTPVRSHL
ncbi:MAG: hypothetical protein ACE5HS_18855 [bacterium]